MDSQKFINADGQMFMQEFTYSFYSNNLELIKHDDIDFGRSQAVFSDTVLYWKVLKGRNVLEVRSLPDQTLVGVLKGEDWAKDLAACRNSGTGHVAVCDGGKSLDVFSEEGRKFIKFFLRYTIIKFFLSR